MELDIFYLTGAAVTLSLIGVTAYRLLRRRRGVVSRLAAELGFEIQGAERAPRLVGTVNGVATTILPGGRLTPPVLRFALPPGGLGRGLQLRDFDVETSGPRLQLSSDGTVFDGPWRRWGALLDPRLLSELDTVGRYWRFTYAPGALVLSPLVAGVFEDFEWLQKTLDRVARLIASARALGEGEGEDANARFLRHLAAAPTRDLAAIYLDALGDDDAASGEIIFEGQPFPSLRAAAEHAYARLSG